MRKCSAIWCGAVLLLAASCAGRHRESAEVEVGRGLAPVEGRAISLADAIRSAAARAPEFIPVAAGVAQEDQDAYEVALLDHGRVQQVAVDARTGAISAVRERPVRPGSEAFASKLEEQLPSAKLDLARAVEVALAQTAGGRALGVEVQPDGDGAVYHVTLHAGPQRILVAIDAASGEVLPAEEEHGEAAAGFHLDLGSVPEAGLPGGWRIAATDPAGPLATWGVVQDSSAQEHGKALALSSTNHASAKTFNLCWTDLVRFQDGAIQARLKAVSGRQDQGGGVIWRAVDEDNYYVCRANPLEGNFRLYAVVNGVRRQLASSDVEFSAGDWHRILVEQQGEHITCSFDGEKMLDTIDETFPDAGGIGFWTKADAVTSFDDLRVTPSSPRESR